MPRAAHNLVQDIALKCNHLTLYRPNSYRCLLYLPDIGARLHLRFSRWNVATIARTSFSYYVLEFFSSIKHDKSDVP